MAKENRRLPISLVMDADERPEVLRAHTIADTIKALVHHGALDMIDAGVRNAVAAELAVPALWIDAAACEHVRDPRVDLELLAEWCDWRERFMPTRRKGGVA